MKCTILVTTAILNIAHHPRLKKTLSKGPTIGGSPSPLSIWMETNAVSEPWGFQSETMYSVQNISHGYCFILL
jgi:hypothetical protein